MNLMKKRKITLKCKSIVKRFIRRTLDRVTDLMGQ